MNRPRGTAIDPLPEPDPVARAHSLRLEDFIRREIGAAGGAIGFRRYMELALYAPGLGYYSAGATRFGRGGDFTTAPELSPLFAACVARQCAQILERTGGSILELGAGSGVLALGILDSLRDMGRLPEEYLILEPSADLRRCQQALLAGRSGVRWLDALPARPLRGVILANEVLDALPVHRVRLRGGSMEELRVRTGAAGFEWTAAPAGPELAAAARATLGGLDPLPVGYTTEFNLDLRSWIAGIGAVLGEGAILLFDYGYPRREYYHPDRVDGTLVCHYRHRVHADPFLYPGLQDISASVDFTAVAEAAAAAGLQVAGFTTQAHFLIGCGLHELLPPDADERSRAEFGREAKLLTLPGEMGERFKAMALLRGAAGALTGFGAADHRRRL